MSEYAKRVDGNHAAIREAVRAAGYQWVDTFRAGHGFPDALVISKSHVIALLEVKQPGETLTAAECKFWDTFTGPIAIVRSEQEALDVLYDLDKLTATVRIGTDETRTST